MQYSFCPKCGHSLETRWLEGRERLVCSSCGFIFYQNSKPCVGALVVDRGQVLLVQRAIEPYRGYWDIPGGFLEAGEHPETGTIRELEEETGLLIKPLEIFGIYPETYGPTGHHTLSICYLAEVVGGEPRPADDVSRLQWFDLEALPEKIAFEWPHDALALLRQRYR